MTRKYRVLVVCTGNSCRSQMAEGLIRADLGDRVEVESAGTMETYVHPLAVLVMDEIGIDISGHRSKRVDEFDGVDFDLAITLCESARDVCGIFPWAKEQVHIGFDDPTSTLGGRERVIQAFRDIRDEIRERLIPFIEDKLDKFTG